MRLLDISDLVQSIYNREIAQSQNKVHYIEIPKSKYLHHNKCQINVRILTYLSYTSSQHCVSLNFQEK